MDRLLYFIAGTDGLPFLQKLMAKGSDIHKTLEQVGGYKIDGEVLMPFLKKAAGLR